jgi:hypothetical protein
MHHLDPELLSLLALDERAGDETDMEHLRTCGTCAAEYAALRRTADAVRADPTRSALVPPGPQVWAAIHSELGLNGSLAEDPLSAEQPRNVGQPGSKQQKPGMRGARLPGRAIPGAGLWLTAAAAVIIAAAGITWAVTRQAPEPAPLAATELEPLEEFSVTGTAQVVRTDEGARQLTVELSEDVAQGYQEVWLIKPDLSGLISLGTMEQQTQTFTIPAEVSLDQYPIVDVSDEPVDGDPAHSGISIVRGSLSS